MSQYVCCVKCYKEMTGLRSYEKRRKCEKCGGNKTKYNAGNVNPDKPKELQGKSIG